MKKYIKIFGALMVFGLMLTSCQEELEVGDAGAVKISGDWVVNYYPYHVNKDSLVNSYGPYTVQIYNTSFGMDSVWVNNVYDDGITVKSAKISETSFGVSKGVDAHAGFAGTIDISEAEVIGEDSIIYRVVLTDVDGAVYDDYYAAGHRYTGWVY